MHDVRDLFGLEIMHRPFQCCTPLCYACMPSGGDLHLWTNEADDLHDASHQVLIFTRVGHGQGIEELAEQCGEAGAQIRHRKPWLPILLRNMTAPD